VTIKSRPDVEVYDEFTAGNGKYCVKMTFEQLQLLGSFLHFTSLGTRGYAKVAYDLTDLVSTLMNDQDFTSDSFKAVDPMIIIHDYDANTSQLFNGEDAEIKVK
jgi:hypothetical protein